MAVFDKILRSGEGRKLKALQGLVPDINALEAEIEALSDAELQAKTPEFRQRLENGEDLDDLLFEAFAVCREAAKRVIGQRHFDVQLMGGAALHFGWIAEMKTGEGKTLVSTLPAYLNGLTGKGMHLITVNDYLASFHAEWMGRIHHFLGLDRRPHRPRAQHLAGGEAGAVRLRHHLRHQQRVRLRLPPRQHGHPARPTRPSGATSTPSSTRSTRSSSTRPAPRSSSPAGWPTRPSSTTGSPRSSAACSATSTTRSTRRSASSPRSRTASRRSRQRSASRTSTTASPRTSCTSSRPR